MSEKNIFGRKIDTGYIILYTETGEIVTSLDINEYPVGSDVSTRYEHPEGIALTLAQCLKNNIETED